MISILSFAEKGWEPSERVVRTLLKRMKKAGLRTDWRHCVSLSQTHLVFCDNIGNLIVVDAKKTDRKWKLFTEKGQELNA